MKNRLTLKLIGFALLATLLSTAFVAGCDGSTVNEEQSASNVVEGSTSADVLPPTATATPPSNEFAIVGQPEPFQLDDLELVGLDGWINSEPVKILDLIDSGQVVLLDFWTYTCVNCVRTFPYLGAWHDTYADHGLAIIGVHSPEFDFEKVLGNVQQAADGFGLAYPIALDSEKQTWDKYGNHFWPSKYLIESSGEVSFRHFGEGGYEETESIVREALEAAGHDLSGVPRSAVVNPERSQGAHTVTRELYGGYSKNYLSDGLYAGQDAYYETPDSIVDYTDDGTRRPGQFFLDGRWLNMSNAVVTQETTASDQGQFAFEFFATSVNSVLSSESEPIEVLIEIDGEPLNVDQAGSDVSWDEDGNSILTVTDARLYQIVELPEFGKHELVLKTDSEGLAIYTVTFGVNEFGP